MTVALDIRPEAVRFFQDAAAVQGPGASAEGRAAGRRRPGAENAGAVDVDTAREVLAACCMFG
jgi:hypothetical protein